MQATQLYDNLHKQLIQNHLLLSEPVITKLTDYLLLLEKWNQVYNLTSIRDPSQMIPKHILDSLAISPYLQGTRILDVGTGAGLPGIPLALTHPNCHFTLLDSNGKKTRFLTHVIQKLAISNIDIIQNRVEQFHVDICFDSIITRAFTSLTDFLQKTHHLACQKGIFLSMKGQYPMQEINKLDSTFSVTSVNPIHINGLNEKRHVIVIKLNAI
ncbi:MAG: 16S rRNA (guanine(527)-N(7))-methyltransferase RsmG [Pseudomonadota bacterium]